jgi:hypothetical protein
MFVYIIALSLFEVYILKRPYSKIFSKMWILEIIYSVGVGMFGISIYILLAGK